MPPTEAFAPAKINLTLHVTGQRGDGYHLLDSLVAFADVGDRVTVTDAPEMSLTVTGPRAGGVPDGAGNLCWQAAAWFGRSVAITLDKHLPAAAGIGGGSSDAAAVLRAMSAHYGLPVRSEGLARLGADVPVCALARAARMRGIGDWVQPVSLPALAAVLVNPGVAVSTPDVFSLLTHKDNPPMSPEPDLTIPEDTLKWLVAQRNDLQSPALTLHPVIGEVLTALRATQGARLCRMSGSGATCFALYDGPAVAAAAAEAIQQAFPHWWVAPATLR